MERLDGPRARRHSRRMDSTTFDAIHQVASLQGSSIARDQLRRLGMPTSTIDRYLKDGRLRPDRAGCYTLLGATATRFAQLWRAVLVVGHDAVISYDTAVRLHGLWSWSSSATVHVTVTERCHVDAPGVRIHHTRRQLRGERCQVHGLPAVSVARSICDVAGNVSRSTVADLVADATSRGLVTSAELLASAEARKRFPGRPAVLAALARLSVDQTRYRSKLERHSRDAIVVAALPAPRINHPVVDVHGRLRYLDHAWPQVCYGAELNGPHHAQPTQQRKDAVRLISLESIGWTIDQFTPEDVWRGAHVPVIESRLRQLGHPSMR